MARGIRLHMSGVALPKPPLQLLSVVIPAQNEKDCIASTIEHLYVELRLHNVPHEIVVVDDGSTDETWTVLDSAKGRVPTLSAVKNPDAARIRARGRPRIRPYDRRCRRCYDG